MSNAYSEDSEEGVDISCVDITMYWEPTSETENSYDQSGISPDELSANWKINSSFYLKLIKYSDELIPLAYINKKIFKKEDNPDWNTRDLFRFKYGHINQSYIKEFIGQLVDDDSREPNSICFKIMYFKIEGGGDNIFYPIRASKNGGTTVGLGDDQIMNLNENSFNIEDKGLISYSHSISNLIWEFYFGYYVISDIWSDEPEKNSTHRFRNPLYLSHYSYSTGHVPEPIKVIYFQPLIFPTSEIKILSTKQYDFLFLDSEGDIGDQTSLVEIPEKGSGVYNFQFSTQEAVKDGKIEFEMSCDDLLYRTYKANIKTINADTSNLSIVAGLRTGIDPSLYTIDINIFTFEIVNDFGKYTSTIKLGGDTTFYINIVPSGVDINDLGDTILYFNFINPQETLIKVPSRIVYPKINSAGEKESPSFKIESRGTEGDVDTFEITNSVDSDNLNFKNLAAINSITINVANLYINKDYMLIDISDPTNLNYSDIVRVLPRRSEDITEELEMSSIVTASVADFVTFEYITKVVDNKIIITEKSSLAVELETFNYDDVINGKQGDVFLFDTSDESNYGHKLSFYKNETDSIELKNTEETILAEYSRTYPQGRPHSYVSITLPIDANINEIFYRTSPDNALRNYHEYGYGKIKLDILTYEPIGTFTVGNVLVDDVNENGGKIELTSNEKQGQVKIDITVKDNNLFGEQSIGAVFVRTISITPPINLTYYVINDNDLYLNWNVETEGSTIYEFADPTKTRYLIDVTYEILRQTYINGVKEYEVIGVSDKCAFFDSTSVRFKNYYYKVRAVIKWKEAIVFSTNSEELFTFVCQNNHFPEGRWNNTTSNKKLYKNIGSNCVAVNKQFPEEDVKNYPGGHTKLTTNLFPNSKELTKAERYSMLANSSGRTMR